MKRTALAAVCAFLAVSAALSACGGGSSKARRGSAAFSSDESTSLAPSSPSSPSGVIPTLPTATTAKPAGGGPSGGPSSGGASGVCGFLPSAKGSYRHVVWIWMENHSYGSVIGSSSAPFENQLAGECGLATNYHNITHPSLPNYIGATSGSPIASLGRFTSDCDPSASCSEGPSVASIFSQAPSWRAYEESMPVTCFHSSLGEYAVRHNPPPYFQALSSTCLTNDVPLTAFADDLASGNLAAFSFVTPNLIDDTHDGSVADGDRFLRTTVGQIVTNPEYRSGTVALFITWDEGEGGSASNCAGNTSDLGCHVATIVVSPSTPPGTRSGTLFNHYSLLRTAEDLLGLPLLGSAGAALPMEAAFRLSG